MLIHRKLPNKPFGGLPLKKYFMYYTFPNPFSPFSFLYACFRFINTNIFATHSTNMELNVN